MTHSLAAIEPWDHGAPHIHGPAAYGAGVGTPFSYAVPACGKRPLTFSIEGLPEGLTLDAAAGFITGSVKREGEWEVLLKAFNVDGRDERMLRIVAGGRLALAPPLGWMTWYCWGSRGIDQAKTIAAADAMVSARDEITDTHHPVFG